MHIEMPKTLFSSQCPEMSQAITIPTLTKTSSPWVLVKEREQQRDMKGSTSPNCDLRYNAYGDRQKKSEAEEAIAVNAVTKCETEEKR
uniref:Uncharacterized protein n=1 Tax=Nymphaea colorata TaxID=210225 RepID=A0A5K0YC35_9MAGN|nr:unnamed protein product [Nymphaea colorata]